MEFLKDCARRLDEGEAAECVMMDLRLRYTTVRCLNVKTSLIRNLCKPSEAFALCANGDEELLSGKKQPPENFPPRLPENVRALKLSRDDMKACKRLHAASAVQKNKKMVRVNGRKILHACREEVSAVAAGRRVASPLLILALMLVTGRRTCEIVNGKSRFVACGNFALKFVGQAKKRAHPGEGYVVPCLHRTDDVTKAIERLRLWTHPPSEREGLSVNQAVSQKYQSWLRRTLGGHPLLCQVGKVHALRGVYARMAYQLFEWEDDCSEAYVVMHILGHAGLNESLVYTAYHIGKDFCHEPTLGGFPWTLAQEASDQKVANQKVADQKVADASPVPDVSPS